MKNHLVTVVDRARQGLPIAFKRTRSGGSQTSSYHNLSSDDHQGTDISLLPPELWLHIFAFLATPPTVPSWTASQASPWQLQPAQTEAIRAVTLTCHAFRQLAQPFLFARIATHGKVPKHPYGGIAALAISHKYKRRAGERMDFFLLPHIAVAVKEVCIDPFELTEADGEELDGIIDGLSRFPNLTTLVCRNVRMSVRRIAALHDLSLLSSVTLESCGSELSEFASSALPPLPLSVVAFKYPPTDKPEEALASLFAIFLSPKHLQRLSSTSTQVIPALARSSKPFNKFVAFDLPVFSLPVSTFLPALAQCPSLERLNLQTEHISASTIEYFQGNPPVNIPRSGVPTSIAPSLLTHLRFYRGPRNFAALFCSRNNSRVHTVELTGPSRAHRLIRTLRSLPPTVESLSFRLDGEVPKTLFTTIHGCFPNLRTLSMNDPALSLGLLQSLLGDCSHNNKALTSLRTLRVRVAAKERYNLWVPPVEEASDIVHVFDKLRTEFRRVYPGLTSVKFLHGADGATLAWRTPNHGRKGKERDREHGRGDFVLVTPVE
uniref:F-box domain-containing protein n=1 Tax=Mycena chlorophos TaxID=658473 RepID=A0ABQ0LG46_MYCCL|nr:predicted protein [Mycena chlorophos]